MAASIGVITEAAADSDELGKALDGILDGVRRASPVGLAASKELTTAGIREEFDRVAQRRAQESAALFAGPDAQAGMAAFLSKSRPPWDLTAARDA